MIRTTVVFDEKIPSSSRVPFRENNTVTVIQQGLRSTSIHLTGSRSSDRGVRYSIDHVEFMATENTTKLSTGGSSLFFVEPISGEVAANPALFDKPQGVYNVVVNVVSTTSEKPLYRLVKKFHYVKDGVKMRYVFNMTPEEFAFSRGQFIRKLQTSLDVDHPNDAIEVFLAEPKRDRRNSTWTFICFHVVLNEEIQSEPSAMSILSQSTAENSELSRLYNLFKVINIERCDDSRLSLHQSSSQASMQMLVLVAGVTALIIVLIALLTYICFVKKYKEHLRTKQEQMKSSEGTLSLTNYSPTFISPPVVQYLGFY